VLGSTDDVDIVEISQHGGREEKIDKGENRPDTLDASEMRKKGEIHRREGIPESRIRLQT